MDEDNQDKILDDARKVVKEQSYYMRKALDAANLREALKYSAIMLAQLKTQLLTPRNYYQLFMQIFDEMRVLENYFKEEYRRGRNMLSLYEAVQHATNIIPRLYLLITVGSVYIQTHEVPAKEILNDLLEMMKSVQQPLRGLFLRYYFLKMFKERLPDKGSEYEGEGGDINDAIDIIMRNLSEMNKLWIRMSGKSYRAVHKEKERGDLKMLIGENIIRLSDLEGVNVEAYQSTVLPKMLEIVLASKDHVSQHYIIDCLIQAFPDDYHLATLDELLKCTTTQLDEKVDIKSIFIRLMVRLADYAQNSESGVESMFGDLDIYAMFKTNIDNLVENARASEFKNVLDLMVAFLKFTLKCYLNNIEYVNQILKSCVVICERQDQTQQNSDFDDDCLKNIVKFLTEPLETLSLSILTMDEYPNLMKYLPFSKRRTVAFRIAQAVVDVKAPMDDLDIVIKLINFIKPLLVTGDDYVENSADEFAKEQRMVTRLFHLVGNDEPKMAWKLVEQFLDQFREGGIKRQKFSYPACFYRLAKLARQFNDAGVEFKYDTLFEMMKEFIEVLTPENPELALRLYLQFTLIISEIDAEKQFDEFTYDIASQALLIYAEELQSAEQKKQALQLIVGTLSQLKGVGEENYDTLASNATQYSQQLLKKNESCIAILKCTHLFYQEAYKNETNVFGCFKKTIKLAGTVLKSGIQNVGLYVHILNKFFFFWSQVGVKPEDVQQIIDTIKENVSKLDQSLDSEMIQVYWKNTIEYIQLKQQQGVEGFAELTL